MFFYTEWVIENNKVTANNEDRVAKLERYLAKALEPIKNTQKKVL